MKKIFLLFVLFSFLGQAQFTIPEVPKLQTAIYDYANILSETEKSSLTQKLIQYSDSTSTQIVIITIEDLKGEYIGELAPKWAYTWRIGDAEKDNGILILLSKNDRKTWIAPGRGAEVQLVAGVNGEIIRNVIVPEFKAGSFYNGLDKGTDAIFKVLKGKYKGEKKQKKGNYFPFVILFGFIILFIILSARSRKNGGGGNNGSFGGPDLMDIIILSRMGRGGGFNGGGMFGGSGNDSGVGFSGGFGGGDFSGGGAGGDW